VGFTIWTEQDDEGRGCADVSVIPLEHEHTAWFRVPYYQYRLLIDFIPGWSSDLADESRVDDHEAESDCVMFCYKATLQVALL
jgi:hypothetical protein